MAVIRRSSERNKSRRAQSTREAIPAETLCQVKLLCKISVAARIRTLLLSTISKLPVTLQSIHGEQDDANDQVQIRGGMTTAGRNNEAIETSGHAMR